MTHLSGYQWSSTLLQCAPSSSDATQNTLSILSWRMLSHCSLFQHPVLDEPIAEAVCIIADTDKWTVQVATSQRKVMDTMKLGQDVLVSNQVSCLLQSILQLYKLHLPADFVSIWSFNIKKPCN